MPPAFASRDEIVSRQLAELRALLMAIAPANRFQQKRIAALEDAQVSSLSEFSERVPLTTKAELVEDQLAHPPYGSNLSFPLKRYARFHQTSGTTGKPLRWLDTPESWQWMVESWKDVFHAAGVGANDRILFAFSFGPFLGFWLAFEAGAQLGALCLPGGGLSSAARLRLIVENDVTVVCCTPTYALRLAEVAAEENLDPACTRVHTVLVAGEPGGSVPETRQRIESLWPGARVFDHHGMTEVGPVTYQCPAHPGRLHVLESAYLAEIIDLESGAPATPGRAGELVLTTLGRQGSPLLRYRTGDWVKAVAANGPCACDRFEMALEGGILGRVDDMVIVRGVNIHSSAVEAVLRGFNEIVEYQVEVRESASLAELRVRIEPVAAADAGALAGRVERALQQAFNLRIPVGTAAPGGLPRFEMKARRWTRPEAAGRET